MGSSSKKSVSVARKTPSRKSFVIDEKASHKVCSRPSPSLFDAPSDIIIEVGDIKFSLHKYSLSSRSGLIRKKIAADLCGTEMIRLVLLDLPGGANAFTLAAKFCYGIEFEIGIANVSVLRCAAEYLEMTEEYGSDNLVSCTEKVLNEIVLGDLRSCVQVLCSCQSHLSTAEDLKIVSRCIDHIACVACKRDSDRKGLVKFSKSNKELQQGTALIEWWADELLSLPINLFQQTLQRMKSKGLQTASLAGALMHYALQFLETFCCCDASVVDDDDGKDREASKDEARLRLLDHQKRVVLETLVNLLPAEEGLLPMGFLFRLLRASRTLDTTVACQMDLEKRIGNELEQATLEELVLHSSSRVNGTLFDVDLVHRLLMTFVQREENHGTHDSASYGVESESSVSARKVSGIIDSYLAEVAADPSLQASKFIGLCEAVPKHWRADDDGIYRAVDIYLKAHPMVSDTERKRICKLMDCRKLSRIACSHAAQNDRLPVHVIVQVLYLEQIRLRNTLCGDDEERRYDQLCIMAAPGASDRLESGSSSRVISPRESYATLRQENEELRLEVAKMKGMLSELGVCYNKGERGERRSSSSILRAISRMNPFSRRNSSSSNSSSSRRLGSGMRSSRNSISIDD